MGIYKIEREKRVRVKVRTGAMVRNKYGGGPRAWQVLLFQLCFFLLLFSLRGIMKEMN